MFKASNTQDSSGATELISFDQISKTFVVKEDAVNILKKLSGPVAVVSVCGRARMGKSTLLNQLVTKLSGGAQKGFTVASTHKPCTKGLWLWSKPIPRKAADGSNMHLLLIDCEGIDAFDQTMDYSTQIFSLGVLLSSLLVFNQMGGIDESAIDKLSSVCEFAKLIQSKSSQTGATSSVGAADFSPSFLWLLRDFQFQLNDEGRQITAREYMEDVLADMAGSTNAVQSRNQMRASVKSLFPERDCFTLVRPCLDEAQLASMDKMTLQQMRPEFRQGFDRLTDLVLSKAQPKQYKGQYLSGSALALFAKAYVEVINSGQVPAISSTWQSVMRTENQRVLEVAIAAYERAFSAASIQQPSSSVNGGVGHLELHEMLDAAQTSALNTALAEFDKQALGDPSERRAFESKLKDQCASRYTVVKQAKVAEAERHASDLISAATRKITNLLQADPVDMDAFVRELETALKHYNEQAAGPSKYKVAAGFLLGVVRDNLAALMKKIGKEAAAATTKLAEARKEAREATGKSVELTQRLKSLESMEASSKQQLQAVHQQVERLQQEVTEKARSLVLSEAKRDALQSELGQARQKAERLEAKVAAAESAAAEARTQASSQRGEAARTATEAAERARELSSTRSELERVRQEAAQARAEAQGKIAHMGADLSRVQTELQFTSGRREAVEVELTSKLSEQAKQLQSKEEIILKLQYEVQQLKTDLATSSSTGDRVHQLTQQLEERAVTVQRLQQERAFLQQQYDTLRRESMSPGFTARVAEPLALVELPVDMEVEEPARKRKRGQLQGGEEAAGTSRAVGNAEVCRDAGGATPAAAAVLAASPAPFSSERRVELGKRGTEQGQSDQLVADVTENAAAAGLQAPENLAKMTVQEIKTWLTENGFEKEVFEYNNRKPAVKKQDWAQLVRLKCELSQ